MIHLDATAPAVEEAKVNKRELKALAPSSIFKSRFAFFFFATLSALALVLRLVRLDFQPLWFDEGYSLYFATSGLFRIAPLTAEDIHPPAYYYLLDGWLKLFGRSDVSARLASVVIGFIAILLLYALGRRLFDRTTGVIAAGLLAISPLHVYYSQEVRMYALVTTLGLASTWFFCMTFDIGAADKETEWAPVKGRAWLLAGYVVSTALAMYTQYYAAFLPLAQGLFLLITWRRQPGVWRTWLVAMAPLALLFLPWVVYAGPRLQAYVESKVSFEGYGALSLFDFLKDVMLSFASGDRNFPFAAWTALPYFLLALLGLAIPWRGTRFSAQRGGADDSADGAPRTRRPVLFILLSLLVPILVGWIINLRFPFHPPMWERLFLFSLPFFLLLVARGLITLCHRSWLVFAAAAIVCVAVMAPKLWSFYTVPRYVDEDYRPVVALAGSLGRPDDLVIAVYPWQIGYYQAYYHGVLPKMLLAPNRLWADDPAQMVQALDGYSQNYRRVWLLSYEVLGRRLETQVNSYLVDHYFPAFSGWFGNSRLLLFSMTEPSAVPPATYNFENKLALAVNAQSTGPLEAGRDVVDLSLQWRALQHLEGKFTVNLRLTDEAGRTWAQRDAEPDAGLQTIDSLSPGDQLEDHHGLLVPSGTPPGSYTLKLGISRNGQGLSVLDANGAPAGREVVLGKVSVVRSTVAAPETSLFIEHSSTVTLAKGLQFLGYSGPTDQLAPGDKILLTLFWRAEEDLSRDYEINVALVDQQQRVVAQASGPPVDGKYPTGQWIAGELVRDQREIRIPAEIPTGKLTAVVSVSGEQTTVETAKVQVVAREHSTVRPAIAHPLAFTIGGFADLVGFDVTPSPGEGSSDLATVRPGETVNLMLYWRPRSSLESDLTVFTHLLGVDGRMWGQLDGKPGGGALPTTGWVPGEYLTDHYAMSVKPETPDGILSIEIGMYDPLTGHRSLVTDGEGRSAGDSIMIGNIEVRR